MARAPALVSKPTEEQMIRTDLAFITMGAEVLIRRVVGVRVQAIIEVT